MTIWELLLIAVGLSMDAFAVSICKGLSMEKLRMRDIWTVGLYFGIFQAGMPLIGYLIGTQFASFVESVDHWVAFVLLGFIGGKMMLGSFHKEEDTSLQQDASLSWRSMLPLAIATSVDALVVGISFAFLQVRILPAIASIGLITLLLCMLGMKIGQLFGARFKSKAEFIGGILLILMGLKILLQHLGIF